MDATQQFTCLQESSPCIDLTDTALTPPIVQPLMISPSVYVTSPVSSHEYSEIQFLLANNFWGVDFQFGNNASGIQIRQGIAHLIDKTSFVNNDLNIAGRGMAVDNPVPPNNGGLLAPNPCLWDATFGESGVNCVVGAPGGTAYHLATATSVNYPW
jgi:hypothetical protein